MRPVTRRVTIIVVAVSSSAGRARAFCDAVRRREDLENAAVAFHDERRHDDARENESKPLGVGNFLRRGGKGEGGENERRESCKFQPL